MKDVLVGMGVKEGASVTDGTMAIVDVARGAAALVCIFEAIDVPAMIVETFICVEGIDAPFPLLWK
jgi:hypothetical protein